MCRLMMTNDRMLAELGRENIELLMYRLDESMGGDGMGVSALFDNGKVRTHKAVDMGPNEASHWMFRMLKQGASYFIFHCRMATTGSIKTSNCHPFTHNGLTLAHNGQCIEYSGVGDRTDSEGLCLAVGRSGLPTSFLRDVTGVFLGFRNGRPFVVKGQSNTALELLMTEDMQGFLFASRIPYEIQECISSSSYSELRTYAWYGESDTADTKKAAHIKEQWEQDYLTGYSYGKAYPKQTKRGYKKHSPFLANFIKEENAYYAEIAAKEKAKKATEAENKVLDVLARAEKDNATTASISYMNGVKYTSHPHGVTVAPESADAYLKYKRKDSLYTPVVWGDMSSGSFVKLLNDLKFLRYTCKDAVRAEVFRQCVDELSTITNDDEFIDIRAGWFQEICALTPQHHYLNDNAPNIVYALELVSAMAEDVEYPENAVIAINPDQDFVQLM